MKKFAPFYRLLSALHLVALGTVSVFFTTLAQAQDVFSIDQLRTEVHSYASGYYKPSQAKKIDITVGQLDRRIQLQRCSKALTFSINDAKFQGGAQSTQITCQGDKPWSLYVPIHVSLFKEHWVASRALTRGHLIQKSDLQLKLVDSSGLRNGQVSDFKALLGKELKRPVQQGDIIRAAEIQPPQVIKRGDLVTIENRTGAIKVSSTGTALGNARIGDKLRVKNNQSSKNVMGEVIDQGLVIVY